MTTISETGSTGKRVYGVSMRSLYSPKRTHHRGGSQPGRQCDSSPEHQPGLFSNTQVPGSRVPGTQELGLRLGYFGFLGPESSGQRKELLF